MAIDASSSQVSTDVSTLTFTPSDWNTAQTVTVTATDDTDVEGDHTATLPHTLTSSDSDYRDLTLPNATVAIADNDTDYAITTSGNVTEGNSSKQTVTFTVTRSGDTSGTGQIDYALGGTATDTEDYNNIRVNGATASATGTVNFAATEKTQTITVDVLGDTTIESSEAISVTLSSGTATGTANVSGSPATITIVDDDTPAPTPSPVETPSSADTSSPSATPSATETPSPVATPSSTPASNSSSVDFSGLLAQALGILNSNGSASSAPASGNSSNSSNSTDSSSDSEITPGDGTVIRAANDEIDDIIAALDGEDNISTGGGNDILFGNRGNDTLDGGGGDDFIASGKDDDRATGGTGNDTLMGDLGNDTLSGDPGNDLLYGNTGNDAIDGGDGNDSLFGSRGSDTITGGVGNDLISGDVGRDELTGGDGADIFQFRTGDGSDIVTDFAAGEDKLRVYEILATATSDAIEGFEVGANLTGFVRRVGFAELAIGTDGADNATVSFKGERLVTLNGTASLSAADFL